MRTYKTIDLWIANDRHILDEFDAAFADGVNDDGSCAYTHYVIVKNCLALATCKDSSLRFHEKHLAIIFYHGDEPIRLLLSSHPDKAETYISHAMVQRIGKYSLQALLDRYQVTYSTVMVATEEFPAENFEDLAGPETFVYSCDRYDLLKDFLNGETPDSLRGIQLHYQHNLEVTYQLRVNDVSLIVSRPDGEIELTEDVFFSIQHRGGLVSASGSHAVIFQRNSKFSI